MYKQVKLYSMKTETDEIIGDNKSKYNLYNIK